MVKLLGSLCVLSGGVLVCWFRLMERRRQRTTLSELLNALRWMAEEIRMVRTPFPRLLSRLERDCHSEARTFFGEISAAVRKGDGLSSAWNTATQALPIPEKAKKVILELGNQLSGDEEKVYKVLLIASNALQKYMEDAEKIRPEEDKRAAALSLSAAALVVILLI